jgi:phage tail P2-like protein
MAQPSLLPPNATQLERNLAAVNARISDIPVPIADLMNADSIPVALLPWLAWHLGVETWNDAWPAPVKRAHVKSAIQIARKKGTVGALRAVMASFGRDIAVREWFQSDPPGQPGTFEVVLTVTGQEAEAPTAAHVADIKAEIDRTKNVRSHYTFTQSLSACATENIVAAARAVAYRRLTLSET